MNNIMLKMINQDNEIWRGSDEEGRGKDYNIRAANL